MAMQLKPDVGTPELPEGTVRVRLDSTGALLDVQEDEIERVNPPEQSLLEELSGLSSVNEATVVHTLTARSLAQHHLTLTGPHAIALRPPSALLGKGLAGGGEQGAVLRALCGRLWAGVLRQRKDRAVVTVGRSGVGKTSCCQAIALELLQQAGTEGIVTGEKLQAVFTVLRSFGSVSSRHSPASSRVSTVISLDYSHRGKVAGAHLQTMLLERWRLSCRPEGESSFLVFREMLGGLNPELRTELQLHQLVEDNLFGISPPVKMEEKQKASAAFGRLLAAMEMLGFSANEQRAIWHVLAGIYHLGVAGACKVGRRQFLRWDSAQCCAGALGCDGEELSTAVFKHHLLHLLQQATGGARERHCDTPSDTGQPRGGPRISAAQCVEGMAAGLYEELFCTVVSLINRSLCSEQLTLASITLVDTPGFQNPRHSGEERAGGLAELCHNYLQERLLELCHQHTFTEALHRYKQEGVSVDFEVPESSPSQVVSAIDQAALQHECSSMSLSQVRSAEGAARGLLWVLDEEVLTPGSTEAIVLDRVCAHYPETVRQCEQPLQCEVSHLLGSDPVRYDLSGWFGLVQNNPSALSAGALLQGSNLTPVSGNLSLCTFVCFPLSISPSLSLRAVVRSLFAPRSAVPPLCRGLGGLEVGTQRSLQRAGTVRKTFSGGLAALRRRSACITVKLQADALINLVRRCSPVFLHCVCARGEGGAGAAAGAGFDIPSLRTQLRSTNTLHILQLHRTGYPDHMSLSDFRLRFQALSPPVMKRYGSVFITPDERKAVEELLIDLDVEKKSIVVGQSRVFMKKGVLSSLEEQREKLVSDWLVLLQAACWGHLARQRYRRMKVVELAVCCVQRNVRMLYTVRQWGWWKLLCRVRPLLDVNIDDHRYRVKEEEVSALRRKLQKSERERNELRQSADALETKVTALTSELSDERFRGDAVCQALDSERAERLRLARDNVELQARLQQAQHRLEEVEQQLAEARQEVKNRELEAAGSEGTAGTESEWTLRLDCAQTEIDFLRRRLRHSDERLESEQEARRELDTKLSELQCQLDESKRSVGVLRRRCRRVTSDLQDARALTDSLQVRGHELERKQRRFDAELAQALGEASIERAQKERGVQELTAVRGELFKLQRSLKESQLAVARLEAERVELSARVTDLSGPAALAPSSAPVLSQRVRELEIRDAELSQEISTLTNSTQHQEQLRLRCEMEMERMKQIHQKELEDKEEELEDVQRASQRRLRQLEMQLEQEYEEKQMVLHEKHDLEGLIATLCEQIGHRDFDVEKRLRRDLKRSHALLADAQLLLSTVDTAGQHASREELEKLHCQLEDSEAQCAQAVSVQSVLARELENTQLELEQLYRHKSLVDEQVLQLQHEKADLLKRLEEDQEDLSGLMEKHKALIAQSSSDISQIRELQAELEEVKKERQSLQEKLQQSVNRVQFLQGSMVERSIVGRQEARVTDLENRLEYQRGQIHRLEALVLRLRDSVVRMGMELEGAAQAEMEQRERARCLQQRLSEMRVEIEELAQREQDSGRRCVELVTYTHLGTACTATPGEGTLYNTTGVEKILCYTIQGGRDNIVTPELCSSPPFLGSS
ncbi:MY18B protein, partial [Amia calva]|nr:MY18B protein [Amia calva]